MDLETLGFAYEKAMSDFNCLDKSRVHASRQNEFLTKRNELILEFNKIQDRMTATVNDFVDEYADFRARTTVTIYVDGIKNQVKFTILMKEDSSIEEIYFGLHEYSSKVYIVDADKYFLSPISDKNEVIENHTRRLYIDRPLLYFDLWNDSEKKYVDENKVTPHTYYLRVKEKFR